MTTARTIAIASPALAGLVLIVIRPEIIAMVFTLVFMGIVPGTSITIPSWVSLGVMAFLVILGVRWALDEPVYRPYATPKDLSRRAHARRKVTRHTAHAAKSRATAGKVARAKA